MIPEFFNPFDNAPSVVTQCYVGTIILADGPIDANGLAFAHEITYRVVWSDMGGARQQDGVIPNHRRPITAPGKIRPAEPNDACIVQVRGDRVKFIIFEGLAAVECP